VDILVKNAPETRHRPKGVSRSMMWPVQVRLAHPAVATKNANSKLRRTQFRRFRREHNRARNSDKKPAHASRLRTDQMMISVRCADGLTWGATKTMARDVRKRGALQAHASLDPLNSRQIGPFNETPDTVTSSAEIAGFSSLVHMPLYVLVGIRIQ
jgi:hypothetical protein